MTPPLFGSPRREQCVERPRPSPDLLQPWVAQPAVPIELDGAIEIAALDQQLRRGAVPRRRLDRLFQRAGIEAAAVHGDDLSADGHAGVERGAVPQHARHLAVVADAEPARIGRVAGLAPLFTVLP